MRIIRAFKYGGKVYTPSDKFPKGLPKEELKMLKRKGCIASTTAPKKPKKKESKESKTRVTKWNLDPKKLKDKSLEQLQVMIVERGGGGNIPESIEDCIAQLTKDFLPDVQEN